MAKREEEIFFFFLKLEEEHRSCFGREKLFLPVSAKLSGCHVRDS